MTNELKNAATAVDVLSVVSAAVFGKPLVTNVFRGHVVEAIVSLALSEDWKWRSEDYASWDFENSQGVRLEVKQSACRQSWALAGHKTKRPQFDVAARQVHWIDGKAVVANQRAADIYVLAFHPLDDETADHRDPQQWQFYVVAATQLSSASTIQLSVLKRLAPHVGFQELGNKVNEVAALLKR